MSRYVLLVCLISSSLAAPGLDKRASEFFSGVAKAVGQEAEDVKNIVAVPVVKTVSAICPDVKEIFGLSYKALSKDEKEPDLSSLALVYINQDVNVRFNMSSAAKTFLNSPAYNPHQNIFVYAHGFTDTPNKAGSFGNISTALYSQGYTNVLGVDAEYLLRWMYLRSSTYVAYIGEKVGAVLADMYNLGVDPSRIHIMGHSLGAHIAGYAGKEFQKLTGKKVEHISGMDPAGPCFSSIAAGNKINKTDANFVDIIHSDAGIAGLIDAVGTVDFYPNEGLSQPGCTLSDGCSHSRSWQLYSESIRNPKAFPAAKCGSWSNFKEGKCSGVDYMGFGASPDLSGKYYLQTTGKPPYSLGEEGTKYRNNQGVVRNITDAVGKALQG